MEPVRNSAEPPAFSSLPAALDEIDRILHQMLLMAELSASDMNVDREHLQKTLERLQDKMNRIADTLPAKAPPHLKKDI